WETLPHERLSPSAETIGARLKALRTLDAWQKLAPGDRPGHLIVVASVRAALQPLAAGLAAVEPIVLTAKRRGYDLASLSIRLDARREPRRHQPRVPGCRLERRHRRRAGADRPGRRRLPHRVGPEACGGRSRLVDAQPLRRQR